MTRILAESPSPLTAWFAADPGRYTALAGAVVAVAILLQLRPLLRRGWRDARGPDWAWGLVILGVLVAGRWPTLGLPELNVDESQMIAGALTLRHDPVFWRSVDGTTSGPLNFYALLPASLLPAGNLYLAARITGLGLIALALTFAHQAIALVCGRAVARASGFAALCLESLTLHPDLLHYSSELVAMALAAAAFYAAVRRLFAGGGWRWNIAGGVLLGCLPLAKLQAAPIAALLAAGWIAGERWLHAPPSAGWRRGAAALGAGLAAPLALVAGITVAAGQGRCAVVSYLLSNANYATTGHSGPGVILAALWSSGSAWNGRMSSLLDGWLVGTGLWLAVAVFLPWSRHRPAQVLASGAGAFFLASVGCILAPHRPILHYWQLAVVPWTLVLGGITGLAMLAAEGRKAAVRIGLLAGALACSAGGVLGVWAVKPHLYVRGLLYAQSRPLSDTTRMILAYARPGEPLGVWGWQPGLFVEGGFRQATREAHTYAQIEDGPYRDYFRRRYLADLERSRPPVFVDVVGPQAFWFQDPVLAHDASFPELAAYVQANYTLVGRPEGSRVYVRNDRVRGSQR